MRQCFNSQFYSEEAIIDSPIFQRTLMMSYTLFPMATVTQGMCLKGPNNFLKIDLI